MSPTEAVSLSSDPATRALEIEALQTQIADMLDSAEAYRQGAAEEMSLGLLLDAVKLHLAASALQSRLDRLLVGEPISTREEEK